MVRLSILGFMAFRGEGGRATGEGPCGAQLIRRCGLLFRPARGPVRSTLLSFPRRFSSRPYSLLHVLSLKTLRLNVLTEFSEGLATACPAVRYGGFRLEKSDSIDEIGDNGNKTGGGILRHLQ